MSEITMATQTVVEHRTLECLVWQFDPEMAAGQMSRAILVLDAELRMRGSHLVRAHRVKTAGTSGSGDHVAIMARRGADGVDWAHEVQPHEWLVVWLHRERVLTVDVMPPEVGETLFRPLAPIIQIRPGRGTIES